MSAGTRRNGSSKFGPFTRTASGHRDTTGRRPRAIPAGHGHDAYAPYDQGAPYPPAWEDSGSAYYGGAAYDEPAAYDHGAAYDEPAAYYDRAAYNEAAPYYDGAVYDEAAAYYDGAVYDEDAAYYDGAAYDEAAAYDGDAAFPAPGAYDQDASYAATVAWDAAADPAHDVAFEDDAADQDRPGSGSDRRTGRSGRATRYTGRHTTSRRKTARIRARQAVPAAVVAAAFAAGAATYILAGSDRPQAAQLSAAMSGPLILSGGANAGRAETAASAMIQATKTLGTASHRVAASRTASPKASSHAKVAAGASVSPTAAAATPTASASSSPSAATLSCNLSYGLLPDNVTAIVSFLLANGYTDNAAAGIAGNIYQESKGDPESIGMGGGGLIGWTPLPSGFVTGDPSADLQTQLAAILTYNQEWSSYLPALNSAASPSDAAYIYVTYFERAGIPAAATREASAENVAAACGI